MGRQRRRGGGGGADRKKKKNKVELGQGPRNVRASTTKLFCSPPTPTPPLGEEIEGPMQRTSLNQIKRLTFWAWAAPCSGVCPLFVARESFVEMLTSGPECGGVGVEGPRQKGLEQGQPDWTLRTRRFCLAVLARNAQLPTAFAHFRLGLKRSPTSCCPRAALF